MKEEFSNDKGQVDADTSLVDLDKEKLKKIKVDVNVPRVNIGNNNESSLFASGNLFKKTVSNLEEAEALDKEEPLWTEKTAELEERNQLK